ncbi:hypothetical protein L1887_47664 [Cichorium endivia]|nr:hypothetical protein L1887_47664 [Cichorium endivia]
MREGSRRTGFRPNRARSQRADGEYAAEQPQGLPAVIAELTRWAAQNLELTLKSEINVGPRLSEEGRLKRRSRKCNTTRGEPKACAKEEANQSEWRQGGEKRKIEQCKGERSCPLFSGNPPPHMSKKRERGRKNNRFTLAHEIEGPVPLELKSILPSIHRCPAKPAHNKMLDRLTQPNWLRKRKAQRPSTPAPKSGDRQVVEDTSEEEAGGL